MTGNNSALELFLTEDEISGRVAEMAGRLNNDYKGKDPVLIAVLAGSLIFTSDLIRNINVDHTLVFTKVKSYSGTASTNHFDFQLDLEELPEEKDLVIIEDIVDTGNTLNFLMDKLKDKKPMSISVATLLLKPGVYRYHHKIDYVGFEIPDKFVVGYGMDLDHKFRNLRDIYIYNKIK